MYTYKIFNGDDIKVEKCSYHQSCKYPMHLHDFVEMVYIISGKGKQYIGNKEYSVKHGDLLYINYGQCHGFEAQTSLEYVNILINPVFISRELVNSENIEEIFALSLFEEFGSEHNFLRQAVTFTGNELLHVDETVKAMLCEFSEKKIGYKSALRGYLQVIFTLLLRNLSQKANAGEAKIENLPKDIEEYIEENCFDKITLADIAGMSFYNPAYFGRLLKKHYGKTFSAYIKEKRMNKAAELLLDKTRTVEEIIRLVGYSDRKLFYKHFKEFFNKTPKEYKDETITDLSGT